MSKYNNEILSNFSPPLPPKLCQKAPPIPPKMNINQNNVNLNSKSEDKLLKIDSNIKSNIPKIKPRHNVIVQNEGYNLVESNVQDLEFRNKDSGVIYENRNVILSSSIEEDCDHKPNTFITRMKNFFKKKHLKKVKCKEQKNNEYFPSHKSSLSALPSRNNHISEISDECGASSGWNKSWYEPSQTCCSFHAETHCRRVHVARCCHFDCVPVCSMHPRQHCCQMDQFVQMGPVMPNIVALRCANCQPQLGNTHFHSRTPSLARMSSSARTRSVQSNHDRQSPDNNMLESVDSITDSRAVRLPISLLDPVETQEQGCTIMSLHENLQLLRKVGWYWGPLNSEEAEEIVGDRCDGTFIVRDSSHADYLFSITFRVNKNTHHTRIQFSQNMFWLSQDEESSGFKTVIDLIDSTIKESMNGNFRYFQNIDNQLLPTYAVILLYPLSRFRIMCSLKHIARFVIVSHVRSDHLDQLPLPEYLISYLQDKDHHYVENFYNYVNIMKASDLPPIS